MSVHALLHEGGKARGTAVSDQDVLGRVGDLHVGDEERRGGRLRQVRDRVQAGGVRPQQVNQEEHGDHRLPLRLHRQVGQRHHGAELTAETEQQAKDHEAFLAEVRDHFESVDAIERDLDMLSKQDYDRPGAADALMQASDSHGPEKVRALVAARSWTRSATTRIARSAVWATPRRRRTNASYSRAA